MKRKGFGLVIASILSLRSAALKKRISVGHFAVLTPERQLRQVLRVQGERGSGEPQGQHFGFVEVANEDLTPFDFNAFSVGDVELA